MNFHGGWDPSYDPARDQAQFKTEKELQNFLTVHPDLLEYGLRIYGDGFPIGSEFWCGGSHLDILAEDRYGGLVAIEIKLKMGLPAALGQLLGYMASIRRMPRFYGRHLRGLIVCQDATDLLLTAAEDQRNISVYEWTNQLTINRILDAQEAHEITPPWKNRHPNPEP
jgi:RecB family endonuclease NucS